MGEEHRGSARAGRCWLERGKQRSELADALQAVPALSRHRLLGHMLVMPRERVRDMHAPRAKRDDRRDIGTERVADHHELAWLNVPAAEHRAVGLDVLFAQDLDSLEQVRET